MDLSVIVLSFNTKDITNECLEKLKKAVDFAEKEIGLKSEVIVLDNASSDGSIDLISQKHSWVKLITSPVNTGFSGGNNLAMKECKGKHILLLNSDAFVKENTLIDAINFFESHPDCDVLGCKLEFAHGSLQPSAGYLPTPINTTFWISGLSLLPFADYFVKPIHPKNDSFFEKMRQVEWVMGAFFMLNREVYERTKGFDDSIFMYGEEVEWCKRIEKKGFKMYYCPDFSITHLDKASSKGELAKPLLNEVKGLVRYFHQHYKNNYFIIKIILGFFLTLRLIIFTILGKSSRRKAYFEALKII